MIWSKAVGEIALHPTLPVIAFFEGSSSHQFRDPQAAIQQGSLHELNFETEEVRTVCDLMLDERFSYHPNGKAIFCCRIQEKAILPRSEIWGAARLWDSKDEAVPAICEVDRISGKAKVLGLGWSSCVTLDKKDLVADGYGSQPVAGGEFKWFEPREIPDYRWPVTYVSRNVVLASALPLRKEDVHFFPWTGSISGRHQKMRLGLFETKTNRAFVARDDLDRYDKSTFVSADYEPKPLKLTTP